MGKRARKTRWRALDIADDHSDSEESNTNSSVVSSRYSRSNSNGYFSKYSYSSQSTPARRRYNQYDGSTKSTRSSSTTSETKITFNEDEYTRITTPRQDVLFKKGYLNKPKIFNTQTSTGNSTISTGNSTENGTPDHQSTDLDYESQFLFSNGFVDQNGIYYVNSYEPYPLMLFNPPTYYPEFSSTKSKRHSTGSWSESMSPSNEEATSQDLSQSGGEASTSGVSDYSGGPAVFNMVYPGYYVNGACTPTEQANGHQTEPVKKLKKRRERKSSKTIPGDSSEFTDENSGDDTPLNRVSIPETTSRDTSRVELTTCTNVEQAPNQPEDVDQAKPCINNPSNETANDQCSKITDVSQTNGCADQKTDDVVKNQAQTNSQSMKSVLKADAEEFVPRAYQHMPHLKMMPPNFVPIPLVPIGEFGTQNFVPHPAFIPPGIPINFIPHHIGQKMFPPVHGYVSYSAPMIHEPKIEEVDQSEEGYVNEDKESTATPSHTPVIEESIVTVHSKTIDIATVVSKLEAVKKQETAQKQESDKPVINEGKPFRATPRFARAQHIKKNFYNKQKFIPGDNEDITPKLLDIQQSPMRSDKTLTLSHRNSPTRQISQQEDPEKYSNGHISKMNYSNQERFQKRTWRPNGYQKKTFSQSKPEPVHINNKNYSESSNQIAKTKVNVPVEDKVDGAKTKSNSQWISVSGRKRKKNVKLDDSENGANEEDTINEVDLFEPYDVNQLVDVVPPSQLATPETEDKRIEEILTSLAQTEITDNSDSQIVIPEVSAIEKDLIQQINTTEELVEVVKVEPQKEVANDCEEETFKTKKKSKKGTQKPLTKKVIITDIFDDLTVEAKPSVKPLAKKVEVKVEKIETEELVKEAEVEVELPEKKSKKKRKKNVKLAACASVVEVDSYDSILESRLTGEGQKTTDEISLELDKLIQQGMYNSLHEKFKMINVEPEMDPFFKSIGSVLAPSIKDKTAALKAPDFNRIFQSTRQFLKPNMVSVDDDIKVDDCDDKGIKTYSSAADAADPSSGLDVNEADEKPETPVEVVDNDKNLYPITQAVKEWMSKTREATPEVDILKSPSTIQMEFSEIDHDQVEEEIVLFSSEDQSDLLEYWDDIDVVLKDCDLTKDIVDTDEGKPCVDGKSCDKCRTDSITQGDEEIAVYESKYGQNEAFLHIQKELGQKPKTPYIPRAVCCSLQ